MLRRILVLSLAALGISQADGLAACPSGLPNEIFCDDFDTYCLGGGYPGGTHCATGATVDNTVIQAVWQRTSIDESTGGLCGTEFIVDSNPIYFLTSPFSGRHPCYTNDQVGQSSVVNWNESSPRIPGIGFLIDGVWPGAHTVQGTDAAPLILQFYLSGVNKPEWALGGGLSRSTAYIELALGSDRANTDYVLHPYCGTYCNPPINQGPFPITCAAGNPENGVPLPASCPSIATAPIHSAIAIGTMNMLDPDPCHCGVQEHGGVNWKLTLFDGQLWWNLRSNSPMPSTGTLEPEGNAPMPPGGATDSPGNFQLAAGRSGGSGPPNQWVTLTIKTSTFDVEMINRNEAPAGSGYIYRISSRMENIPRKYLGGFDQLRGGLGAGCELSSSSSWTNNCKPGGRHCIVTLKEDANAVMFDDVVLHGGMPFSMNGACCLDNADCVDDTPEAYCVDESPAGLGGRWRGANTTCATLSSACCPYPFADTDHDGDVDNDDFGGFQTCYTGTGGGVPTGCACLDRNSDGSIDSTDFTQFNRCYSGPNVPWSPAVTPLCTP